MDHEPPSAEMCRTVAVDALVSSSRLKAPVGSMTAPGRRKPVAALRNPADSSASLAMAAEVALVDSAVWALISFRTPMLRAMFWAAPVCWRGQNGRGAWRGKGENSGGGGLFKKKKKRIRGRGKIKEKRTTRKKRTKRR